MLHRWTYRNTYFTDTRFLNNENLIDSMTSYSSSQPKRTPDKGTYAIRTRLSNYIIGLELEFWFVIQMVYSKESASAMTFRAHHSPIWFGFNATYNATLPAYRAIIPASNTCGKLTFKLKLAFHYPENISCWVQQARIELPEWPLELWHDKVTFHI